MNEKEYKNKYHKGDIRVCPFCGIEGNYRRFDSHMRIHGSSMNMHFFESVDAPKCFNPSCINKAKQKPVGFNKYCSGSCQVSHEMHNRWELDYRKEKSNIMPNVNKLNNSFRREEGVRWNMIKSSKDGNGFLYIGRLSNRPDICKIGCTSHPDRRPYVLCEKPLILLSEYFVDTAYDLEQYLLKISLDFKVLEDVEVPNGLIECRYMGCLELPDFKSLLRGNYDISTIRK